MFHACDSLLESLDLLFKTFMKSPMNQQLVKGTKLGLVLALWFGEPENACRRW
jgi:hypothetical protein